MEVVETDEMPIFAQNLQRILEERNLQQSEVAEASGLKRDAFGRYYHGKTPPPAKKLIAIARALKVKPSDINPDATGLDDVEMTEIEGDPIYQMTPAMSRRAGYLMLRINTELPAGMAVRIVEEIERQLQTETKGAG
ncbi:helix-turn-helix domain-containing protein [Sulfitobacter sp. W002]|uniref:helix-turn-helix domain-containing protein n=1 Tax=Sulfitobacter sp. W002 TaxID=2867024 RepID=UPI0021A79358|nr:helix-turn-helix domain-containing protein [Sulfitobacter sp. W002]UWR30960.1 helix-turn-helix domain-containing protein [Sulfitobacter sp. W002]